jgi:hypothetical protein
MIRLMELGPDDAKVTGRVDPKTLEDFWQNVVIKDPMVDSSKATHDAFINPARFPIQARQIRDDNEAKYMEGVTLTSDPVTILNFKLNVHTYVLQNCATSECHGGEKGGNFRLVNPASSSEQMYTNYYIMAMYSNAEGFVIDRANPEKSLLLQYGLPWAVATIKHPKVEVRKLTGLSDPRYLKMLDWVKSLGLTRPNYHVSYELPGMAPVSATRSSSAATASQPAPK